MKHYCSIKLIFYFFTDRVAVIIIGIITLILGILLTTIPWLDYFILKVNFLTYKTSKYFKQKY